MSAAVPPPPAIRVGAHPVRRLVAVLAVPLVVFGAVAWSGAANPRVALRTTPISGDQDPASGWMYASVEVVNDGTAAAEVEAVEPHWPAGRPTDPPLLLVRHAEVPWEGRRYPVRPDAVAAIADLEPYAPFRLEGGSSRELVVLYRVRCPGDAPEDLVVTVRARFGRSKQLHLGGPPPGSWSTPKAC